MGIQVGIKVEIVDKYGLIATQSPKHGLWMTPFQISTSKYGLTILENSHRPYFSTNPTFKIPLKNPTSYLVEAGYWEKPTSQNPT